jgi:tetratricopeptide (TPR) repeat protein
MVPRYLVILSFAGLFMLETYGCASMPRTEKDTLGGPCKEILNIAERKRTHSSISSKAYAHYSLGMIYDNEGKTSQAVEEYRRVIEINPCAAQAYYRLGSGYVKLGKIDEAVDALKKAADLDKENVRARFLLALIYTAQKNYNEATKEYEAILKSEPSDLAALTSLADLYILGQDLDRAISIYENNPRLKNRIRRLYILIWG